MLKSQQQLADLAGVTRLTVHRALNGRPGISDATRRRIRRLAADNGYRLNTAARAVVTGRHRSVALLTSTQTRRSSASAALMSGVGQTLAERDLGLTLAICSDADLANPAYVPQIVRTDSADGLLINYTDHIPAGLIAAIDQFRLKAVWLNTDRSHNTVRPDDYAAGYDLTRHFLELGHRRVLYLDTANTLDLQDRHYSAHHRADGYRQAMLDAGLKPALAVRGAASDCRNSFLKQHALPDDPRDRPSAVITYGSSAARPLVLLAAQAGIDVPGQLNLGTFGSDIDSTFGFDITSAVSPDSAMGREASQALADLLDQLDESPARFPTRALPFRLAHGATSHPRS